MSRDRWVAIGIGLAALLGAGILSYATSAGVGLLSDDSFLYAKLAMELRNGRTLSIIAVPPGFPAVLALGADPFTTSRLLNLAAFAALAALTGGVVWWSTRRASPALFAAAMVAAAKPLLAVHAMLLSEPLALVLGAAGLWLTLIALERDRTGLWCAAAIAFGLAALVRYAAVVYPLGAVALVALERRWARAALLAGLSAIPLAIWLVRNVVVAGAPLDRVFGFHPMQARVADWGRDAVSVWSDPVGLVFGAHPALRWIGVAAAALLFAWAILRGGRLGRLAGIFAAGYVLFVLVVIDFFDVSTIYDTRMLVPVYVAFVLAASCGLAALIASPKWAPWAAGVACLFVVAHAYAELSFARRVHAEGWGATITTWRRSRLVAAVNALPAGTVVWTNAALQLPWVSAESVRALPRPRTRTSGVPWAGYDSALATIPSGAYVAQFGDSTSYQGAAVRDLMRSRGLDIVAEAPEGALYKIRR